MSLLPRNGPRIQAERIAAVGVGTSVEQEADAWQISPSRRDYQRRGAVGCRTFDACAGVEKNSYDLYVAPGRLVEGRNPVRVSSLNVGTSVNQRPDDGLVPGCRSAHQSCEFELGSRVDRGASCEGQFDASQVALPSCVKQ